MEREEGGEVDDAAPTIRDGGRFVGEHVCANISAEGEYCGEVYLDDLFSHISSASTTFLKMGNTYLVEISIRELMTRMSLLYASTVYEDIDLVPIL